jgi:hypothetical protein
VLYPHEIPNNGGLSEGKQNGMPGKHWVCRKRAKMENAQTTAISSKGVRWRKPNLSVALRNASKKAGGTQANMLVVIVSRVQIPSPVSEIASYRRDCDDSLATD